MPTLARTRIPAAISNIELALRLVPTLHICTARLNSEPGANTIPCVPGKVSSAGRDSLSLLVGSSAGPRSRASVAESMTKPRQQNDAGLTVPCQVHVLAPIRCRRPVDNSVQNCGARTKAQGFHRSRVRLCEIGSIKCARKMQALAKNTAATTNSTVELILASPRWSRRRKNRVGFRMVPWFRGETAGFGPAARAKRR